MHAQMVRAAQEVRVLIATPAKAMELAAGSGPWSHLLQMSDGVWGVLVDEHQRLPWKYAAGLFTRAHWVFCTGDTDQAPDRHGACNVHDMGGERRLGTSQRQGGPDSYPLHTSLLPHFLERNHEASLIP